MRFEDNIKTYIQAWKIDQSGGKARPFDRESKDRVKRWKINKEAAVFGPNASQSEFKGINVNDIKSILGKFDLIAADIAPVLEDKELNLSPEEKRLLKSGYVFNALAAQFENVITHEKQKLPPLYCALTDFLRKLSQIHFSNMSEADRASQIELALLIYKKRRLLLLHPKIKTIQADHVLPDPRQLRNVIILVQDEKEAKRGTVYYIEDHAYLADEHNNLFKTRIPALSGNLLADLSAKTSTNEFDPPFQANIASVQPIYKKPASITVGVGFLLIIGGAVLTFVPGGQPFGIAGIIAGGGLVLTGTGMEVWEWWQTRPSTLPLGEDPGSSGTPTHSRSDSAENVGRLADSKEHSRSDSFSETRGSRSGSESGEAPRFVTGEEQAQRDQVSASVLVSSTSLTGVQRDKNIASSASAAHQHSGLDSSTHSLS